MNKPPRKEECHVLNCILRYLQAQDIPSLEIIHEPNGVTTAPDFLLNFGTYEVNLEITISGDGFILTNDNPRCPRAREPFERSSSKMLKKLENLIAAWINPRESIILSFLSHLPIKNRGRLAQQISDKLQQLSSSRQLCLNTPIKLNIPTASIEIPQVELEAKLTDFYAGTPEYSPLKEILAGSLRSPDPIATASLSLQAEYILMERITEKERKLSHIHNTKWLAILNTHILLDPSLYKTALDELRKRAELAHNFNKIFLIHEGDAVEL